MSPQDTNRRQKEIEGVGMNGITNTQKNVNVDTNVGSMESSTNGGFPRQRRRRDESAPSHIDLIEIANNGNGAYYHGTTHVIHKDMNTQRLARTPEHPQQPSIRSRRGRENTSSRIQSQIAIGKRSIASSQHANGVHRLGSNVAIQRPSSTIGNGNHIPQHPQEHHAHHLQQMLLSHQLRGVPHSAGYGQRNVYLGPPSGKTLTNAVTRTRPETNHIIASSSGGQQFNTHNIQLRNVHQQHITKPIAPHDLSVAQMNSLIGRHHSTATNLVAPQLPVVQHPSRCVMNSKNVSVQNRSNNRAVVDINYGATKMDRKIAARNYSKRRSTTSSGTGTAQRDQQHMNISTTEYSKLGKPAGEPLQKPLGYPSNKPVMLQSLENGEHKSVRVDNRSQPGDGNKRKPSPSFILIDDNMSIINEDGRPTDIQVPEITKGMHMPEVSLDTEMHEWCQGKQECPSREKRNQLAKRFGVSERQVEVWLTNRRAQERCEQAFKRRRVGQRNSKGSCIVSYSIDSLEKNQIKFLEESFSVLREAISYSENPSQSGGNGKVFPNSPLAELWLKNFDDSDPDSPALAKWKINGKHALTAQHTLLGRRWVWDEGHFTDGVCQTSTIKTEETQIQNKDEYQFLPIHLRAYCDCGRAHLIGDPQNALSVDPSRQKRGARRNARTGTSVNISSVSNQS